MGMTEGSEKYEEIDNTHKDNPADPANDLASSKEFVEQVLGAKQYQDETPKGYPDGHSMPALFGWITQEYQREVSKELVDMGKNMESKNKSKK
ncbi:hypothetical protein Halha_1466 [Halobacteroides halobius DSM 5150]|uniref:Uncharacterized protein n=1 Tax=Halobacteroides halobius (strain ATCC 35273 / DSM 5150 / MD-1) TaxID=748449 RepID=L0K8S8_HALHC|nr:hypothetical protein [Halobacteroides halobius]AGB41411.1 hypothetical protein Halha_1466 [Halobacteroides halobius DSM 5150]